MQLAFPDAPWGRSFGIAIIVVGLLAFLLEVEIDNTRVTIGHGQRTWREHLHNGLTRLRTYWPSLALISVAIIVIAMGIERSWFKQSDSPSNAPVATAKIDAPTSPVREEKPVKGASSEITGGPSAAPLRRDAAPSVVHAPTPEPPRAQPQKVAAEPAPAAAQAPSPATQAPPSAAAAEPAPKKEIARGPTQEEIAAARAHRDEGDALFKRLFDAKGAAKVNAIAQEVDAWDRRGADLVVDTFGASARSSYVGARARYEFYPPLSLPLSAQLSPSESQAFFNRRDMLNTIRSRQLALSTLFAADRPK